jgi:hypothetical protein
MKSRSIWAYVFWGIVFAAVLFFLFVSAARGMEMLWIQ